LSNIKYDDNDYLKQHIVIQDLIDLAENMVYENTEKISLLKVTYIKQFKDKKIEGYKSLLEYFDELYESDATRPYSLVLKYNYLLDSNKSKEADDLIEEMEHYKYNDDVAKILFKYYGRNLHFPQNILKYFSIVNDNPIIKIKEKLRFHYYSFVAEAYNRAFKNTYEHLNEIRTSYNYLNPSISEYWIDSTTLKPKEFEAILVKNIKGRIQAKVIQLQQYFFIKMPKENLKIFETKKYNVSLSFCLKGIRAELLNIVEE